MDASAFDRLARALATPGTRRGWLRGLTAVPLLAALAELLGEGPALAEPGDPERGGSHRRHRRKARHRRRAGNNKENRKGKRKDKRRRRTPSPPPAPTPVSPSPSRTPVPIVTYACPGPSEATLVDGSSPSDLRLAQTFVAAQSGALLQIQLQTLKDPGSTGDYLVELLAVDGGKPTNTVLAAVTIPDASVPVGSSTLTASFSGPPLVAGTEYAAALSRPGGTMFATLGRTGNDCPGSAFRQHPSGSGPFTELTISGGFDLVTSVTVLA